MLVSTFLGVYLQTPDGMTINMLAVDSLSVRVRVRVRNAYLCVSVYIACCLVAFQNLADVKQS